MHRAHISQNYRHLLLIRRERKGEKIKTFSISNLPRRAPPIFGMTLSSVCHISVPLPQSMRERDSNVSTINLNSLIQSVPIARYLSLYPFKF